MLSCPQEEVASIARSALEQLQQLLQTSPHQQAAPSGTSAADGSNVDPMKQALLQLADPVALAAAGALPKAPEKMILTAMWEGNVRQALQVCTCVC